MSYRDDYRTFQREAFWTLPRAAFLGLVVAVVSFGFVWLLAPTKVLTPEKVITNYEFFHDTEKNFRVRIAQLRSHKKLAEGETDPSERTRLRIEVGGIQTSCRLLAAIYNSRATQVHRGMFMGYSLPHRLDPAECE